MTQLLADFATSGPLTLAEQTLLEEQRRLKSVKKDHYSYFCYRTKLLVNNLLDTETQPLKRHLPPNIPGIRLADYQTLLIKPEPCLYFSKTVRELWQKSIKTHKYELHPFYLYLAYLSHKNGNEIPKIKKNDPNNKRLANMEDINQELKAIDKVLTDNDCKQSEIIQTKQVIVKEIEQVLEADNQIVSEMQDAARSLYKSDKDNSDEKANENDIYNHYNRKYAGISLKYEYSMQLLTELVPLLLYSDYNDEMEAIDIKYICEQIDSALKEFDSNQTSDKNKKVKKTGKQKREEKAVIIREVVNKLLLELKEKKEFNFGGFAANKKYLTKSLLGWWYFDQKHYELLKEISFVALNELSIPLNEYYENELKNDAITKININDEKYKDIKFNFSPNRKPFVSNQLSTSVDKSAKDIILYDLDSDISNQLLFFDESTIIELQNLMTTTSTNWQQGEIIGKRIFDEYGMTAKWNESILKRRGRHSNIKQADIMLGFFQGIGEVINGPFQKTMKDIFNAVENETKNEETDAEYVSKYNEAPVKKISRAYFKMAKDYKIEIQQMDKGDDKKENSKEFQKLQINLRATARILDWVRCSCEVGSTAQLFKLFEAICNHKAFKGKIIRVKNNFRNEFDAANQAYGYRAIFMNVLYEHKLNNNKIVKMIVEVQLMLSQYMKIKHKMHLYYKIARSAMFNSLAEDFALYSD